MWKICSKQYGMSKLCYKLAMSLVVPEMVVVPVYFAIYTGAKVITAVVVPMVPLWLYLCYLGRQQLARPSALLYGLVLGAFQSAPIGSQSAPNYF
jgi:hypothetical protein